MLYAHDHTSLETVFSLLPPLFIPSLASYPQCTQLCFSLLVYFLSYKIVASL